VWWCALGCEERKQQLPNLYAQCLSESIDPALKDLIQRDVPRTLPNHKKFIDRAGQAMLQDVLHAFASHFPSIGYVQGLNSIAALLLVVFGEAEHAFWAFVCAMEKLNVEGYYTDGLGLLRADMLVLFSLLPKKIRRQLNEQNADTLLICSDWFLTWFARSCPVHTVLRIWDVLFSEGYTILFRVAVGVFHRVKADLLQCVSFDETLIRSRNWSQRQIEHDELLKQSFSLRTGMSLRSYERQVFHLRNTALVHLELEEPRKFYHSSVTCTSTRTCVRQMEVR